MFKLLLIHDRVSKFTFLDYCLLVLVQLAVLAYLKLFDLARQLVWNVEAGFAISIIL